MENHHFSWENPLFQWPFSIATLNYQRVIWRYWTEYWACRFKFQSVPTSSHLASRRMGARSKAPRPCPAELKDSHPWKEQKMLPVGSQNQLCLGCPRIVEAFKVCGSPTQSHIFWRYEDEEGNHGNQEFDSVPSVNYIIGFPNSQFFYPGGRRPSFCHTSPGGFAAGTKHCWTRCVTKNLIITGGCLESCQANMGR